jgi:hypothetical protein
MGWWPIGSFGRGYRALPGLRMEVDDATSAHNYMGPQTQLIMQPIIRLDC